jgi:molecular chaperone HtpG
MKESQEAIYFVTGENRGALEGSPYLEALRARGFEVLLMTDAVDTWAAENLGEFGGAGSGAASPGIKLVNAMRADVKLPGEDDDEAKKKAEEAGKDLAPLVAAAKKVLEGRVRDVKLSSRLRESPACLVLAQDAMPAHLEKIMQRSGRDVTRGKRDLELNPTHPAVRSLGALAAKDGGDPRLGEWLTLLYEQSLVAEGSPLDDPNGFAKRITTLLVQAVG